MRILLISNLFPPGFIGGYELFAADMADELHARGHELTVLTSAAIDRAAPDAAPYAVRRTLRRTIEPDGPLTEDEQRTGGCFDHADNQRALAEAIADHRPDGILLFSLAGLGSLGCYRALDAGGWSPVTIFGDNVFAGVRDRADQYEAFGKAAPIRRILSRSRSLFLSRRVRAEIESELGCRFEHPDYIPAMVRQGAPAPDAPSDAQPRFVAPSRLAEHKGVHILLEAVQIARTLGIGPFFVDLYGVGEVERWMGEVERSGLSGIVSYKGVVPKEEMLRRYGDYDALLLPTWEREAFGAVAIEAAAAGCIPIMTSSIGAAEWLVDGLDCIKIRRTAPALAEAMADLVRTPAAVRHARRPALSRAARRAFNFDRWRPVVEAALEAARRSGERA